MQEYIDQIENIRKQFSSIVSAWNGKDATFYFEGEQYTEDDADVAGDIVDKCDELKQVLEEYNQ